MTTAPSPTRRRDPVPLIAALLTAVGTTLALIAIWTTVYSADGGGSATPYGLRNNGVFGGLVTGSWILLLIAAICGAVAILPLIAALIRGSGVRAMLSPALALVVAALVLTVLVFIGILTDSDALGFDLGFGIAFYLVIAAAVVWLLATILTLVAVISPSKPAAAAAAPSAPWASAPVADAPAASDSWPSQPHREPLLSSPPQPERPSVTQSPYPTAASAGTSSHGSSGADDGATRVMPSGDGTPCPGCGTLLAKGAKFCSQCGTAAPPPVPTCSSCGTPANEGDRFCRVCGGQVTLAG